MPVDSDIKIDYEMPLKLMKSAQDLKSIFGYGSL